MPSVSSCVFLLLFFGLVAAEIKNKGWWKNTVFYQVYPRSFMDSNNDGIGDLKGITSKLQHFKDSGIGAIWLSPIYASPMVDFGYDISDFRDIDEAFGTLEDLQELTKKAKELKIKVIMDLVPNHTSDKHYWFTQSIKGIGKYKNYYVWHEGKENNAKPPNNWISLFSGPAWTLNKTRNAWYLHQFDYRQPDLNYSNPDVQREMEEIITFWLGKGIDGFRVDAIPHVYEADNLPDEPRSNIIGATENDYTYLNHIYTKDDPRTYKLIRSWRNLLDQWSDKNNEDEKVLLTEAYTSLENTTKYYSFGSNVPFNFNFIMNVNNISKPKDFKEVIDNWMSQTPNNESANWVMGNHDRSRTATRYPGRADQMTMLAMILPGIAVTYNGEEIAMEDKLDISWEETKDPQACNTDRNVYKSKSRDPFRTPFQWNDTTNAGFSNGKSTWLPVHGNYKSLNLAKQKNETGSHYNIYRNLTSLRSTSETLKTGTLKTEVLNKNEVLVVARQSAKECILLIINFSDDKTQNVNIAAYTPKAKSATVYVSSVGSGIKWNSKVIPSNVTLQKKASVVLVASINGQGLLLPMNMILAIALLAIFRFK